MNEPRHVENDPETQMRILKVLLENRPEKLRRMSRQECEEDEEHASRQMNEEWRHFLLLYGRTVPADTPSLAEAREQLKSLRGGPALGDVGVVAAHVVLARALLGEGMIAEAKDTVREARIRFARVKGVAEEVSERLGGSLRHLELQVKLAQGRFPALPWILDTIHEEIAVPEEDWPHMILKLCWIAYWIGTKREAMVMAERLRVLMEQGEPDINQLGPVWRDARQVMMDSVEDAARRGREREQKRK